MRVVGKEKLQRFSLKHADVRSQTEIWQTEVEGAEWRSPQDVLARYRHASIIDARNVVFNLKGNRYRLHVKINYEMKVVIIVRIGTHEEYGSWKF